MALARALAVEPSILLLDEPFAALDRNLRLDMQIEVKRLQRQLGLTTILVTHDQDEAMSVADRIAVMNRGRVEQFDTPVAIYDRPQTLFVNGFIGTTNLLLGIMAAVSVLEALVIIGAGIGGFIVYRKITALVDQGMVLASGLEARQVAPVVMRVNAILDDVKDVTATVKSETDRVDQAIHTTIDRIDDTADRGVADAH